MVYMLLYIIFTYIGKLFYVSLCDNISETFVLFRDINFGINSPGKVGW